MALGRRQAPPRSTERGAAKRLSTAAARLALAGYELHTVPAAHSCSSHYLVIRWNLARELASLEAVESFVDEVAGRG